MDANSITSEVHPSVVGLIGRTITRPAPGRMSYKSVGHSRGQASRRLEYGSFSRQADDRVEAAVGPTVACANWLELNATVQVGVASEQPPPTSRRTHHDWYSPLSP
jgi:hypothetical protein